MKKLFFTLSLLFALTLTASAQDSKMTPEALAKKEVSTLSELVGLTDTQVADLYRLFEQKHQMLADKNLSAERKAEVNRIVGLKLEATLTGEQNKKYAAAKETLDKVMSEATQSK